MKTGLLIVAFVVVLSGCVESKRNGTATRNSGVPSAVVSNNATNDSPATNSLGNAQCQDVIKPGDTLLITFTNLSSGPTAPTFDQRVGDDGSIILIYNNVFHAGGKKTGDLEKEILDFYVPRYFVNLTVTVRILSETGFVYVDGAFRNSGRYSWTNGMRLNDAIEAAGGFTKFANRRIKVIHSDGTSQRFRLRGDWVRTNNPALRPGDKIHNPRDLL